MGTDLATHEADEANPHAVTKAQVGLTSVPDVDVNALLSTHLAASNPHSIDLTFFDVFSEAETNARIDYYIDAKIYEFTPASPTDGAGAVGDITYDSTEFHVKVASASWLSFYDTAQVDADIATVQADVDANETAADAAIAARQARREREKAVRFIMPMLCRISRKQKPKMARGRDVMTFRVLILISVHQPHPLPVAFPSGLGDPFCSSPYQIPTQ